MVGFSKPKWNGLYISTWIIWAEQEEKERAEREKREEEMREYQERVRKLEEVERKKRQRELEIEERERRREEERRHLDDPLSRKVNAVANIEVFWNFDFFRCERKQLQPSTQM